MRYLITTTFLFFVNIIIAQNSSSSNNIQNTINATIQTILFPENNQLEEFIENYYSNTLKASAKKAELKKDLITIKQSVTGSGGVDIDVSGDIYKLIFSEGNEGTVKMKFDKNEKGKIASIGLEEHKSSSELSKVEKYNQALDLAARKIESLPKLITDNSFHEFSEENFTKDFLNKTSKDERLKLLKNASKALASAMTVSAAYSENKGVTLELGGVKSYKLSFTIENNDPYKINNLSIDEISPNRINIEKSLLPISWNNFKQTLKEEEKKGFMGTILITKNGKIIHHSGYGMADKSNSIKNSKNTIFDIGSIPIDFTRAAILKLVDEGKISYQDPITKFIKNVPKDKAQITVGYLMNNTSGLQNFDHDESKDKDNDLTWITREEAVKRMLSRPLLAKPGTEYLPSHSGYGLLAAIVEIVSEMSYEEFLTNNFFKSMGIYNTGPYGDKVKYKSHQMAVGYMKQISKPNIPTHWGETSWLIKGSGGMVSTPMDLYTWHKKLSTGDYLSANSKKEYGFGGKGTSRGGSERGYYTVYNKDPDNMVVVCSNSLGTSYSDIDILFRSILKLFKK